MVSIQHLHYFQKVCEMQSFNKAADALFISQPALSLAMKNLEQELKVVLFERSNKGILITPDGEKLLAHCSLLMQQLELIESMHETKEEHRLSICAFPYLVYPDIFTDILNNPLYKDTQLNLHLGRISEILENVEKMRCEIGVVQYNNHQEFAIKKKFKKMNLDFAQIAKRKWAVAVGPNSPLYDCDEIGIDTLKDYRMIRMKDDFFSLLTGELTFQDQMMDNLTCYFTNSQALVSHLLSTTDMFMFCCIQPHFLAEHYKVRMIPVKDTDVEIHVGIIKRKRYQLSSVASEFVNLLKEEWKS